jgi:hypothetical protein
MPESFKKKKNARILTVIFIGYRQLDNTFFFIYQQLHTPRYTFLFIKLKRGTSKINILTDQRAGFKYRSSLSESNPI